MRDRVSYFTYFTKTFYWYTLDKRGTRSFGHHFVPKIRGGCGPPGLPLDPPLKCYFYGLFRGLRSETPNIQDIFVLFMTSQGKGTREGLLKPTKNLGFHNSKNLAKKLSRVLLASHADLLTGSSRVPAPRTPKNVCVGGYCYSGALAREARPVEHLE